MKNAPAKTQLHVDAERRDHVAVVDAGADDHAEARALDQQPQPDPDHERRARRRSTSRKKPKWSAADRTLFGRARRRLDVWRCRRSGRASGRRGSTEIAIVISAWRRSCPWFQRRNSCWMPTPMMPITSDRQHQRDDPAERLYSSSSTAAGAEAAGAARRRLREPASAGSSARRSRQTGRASPAPCSRRASARRSA